jgi:putative ABC transport system permease protein
MNPDPTRLAELNRMRQLLLLATRNLVRNRRRSLTALSAIVFGVVALLLAQGFIEWVFWAMRESAIQGQLGHIQITRPGFREGGAADPYAYLMPADSGLDARLSGVAGVRIVAPRLGFNGLISLGESSVPFLGEGVDPAREAEISVDFRIAEGEDLTAADPSGIIVGRGLATVLGARTGDTLTLLATTQSGGFNAVEGRIRGIFYTSNKAWNDAAIRVPLSLAQQLMRNEGVHQWVVLLQNTEETDLMMATLGAMLHTAVEERYELTAWHELADFYNKTVQLFSSQMSVVQWVIGLIIILGISNTLMMNVSERTGEIGTQLAFGVKRRTLRWQFLLEGALLGILAGVVGAALGLGLGAIISHIGIPMPPPPGMDQGYRAEILISAAHVITAVSIVVATSILAAVIPAMKASRMNITDALRKNV